MSQTYNPELTPEIRDRIKFMEEISLNAWPSHKIELYDGWLIRFSRNYTYRTNAVEQIGPSSIPVDQKVAYCEKIYHDFGTPSIFKINPLISPSFDQLLANRGYDIRHVTQTMTANLDHVRLMKSDLSKYEFDNRRGLPSEVHYSPARIPSVHSAASADEDFPSQTQEGGIPGEWKPFSVLLNCYITEEWMNGLFHLNGTSNPELRRIVRYMYAAIPKYTIAASIEIDGRMVASGLGICDRDYIGIYAVYVSPGCRRRHYARAVLSTLLREGKRHGAEKAYLQVVKGNIPAKSLYYSVGFRDFYTYWFRSRWIS